MLVRGECKASISARRVENDWATQALVSRSQFRLEHNNYKGTQGWFRTGLQLWSKRGRGHNGTGNRRGSENIRRGRRSNVRSVRRHVWGGREL